MADASKPLDLGNIPRPKGPWEYADAKEGYEYLVSVEVNKMSYTDDAGNLHDIHIPTGRASEARDHFANKRWEELAKFPKRDNQQYTDEDFVITEVKQNPTTEEAKGVVIKAQCEPLVKTADGKVVLYGQDGDPTWFLYKHSPTLSLSPSASQFTVPPLLVSARDIKFYPIRSCEGSFVQCGDFPEGRCCDSGSPFCVMVECVACVLGNDIYGFDHRGRTSGAINSSRDGVDAHCCIGAGGGSTCSAQWFCGGGPGRFAANWTEESDGYVEPNMVLFTDTEGVQHTKYIPKGSYGTVVDLYGAGNFDELAKFPGYGK
ncbi:hypothetical protein C8A03DRAFT_32677 [Achaetomium macrosporum]|uniref:Uncharacterized protein n=1 Tax=Achaetomium macrosporum TaxID=79813 RepID=A0AAN7CC72_9PEZI|nr:hypothetical protein C8A03DRAFT_32677 [Achaetomium macrosporum]